MIAPAYPPAGQMHDGLVCSGAMRIPLVGIENKERDKSMASPEPPALDAPFIWRVPGEGAPDQ